jgi:hypothetical protein
MFACLQWVAVALEALASAAAVALAKWLSQVA